MLSGVLSAVNAQDSAYDVEGWKKRFASPTYGLIFAPTEIEVVTEGDDIEETIFIPGFELRIFNGINVAKRGGFYTGYEVGATFLFYSGGDEYSINPSWVGGGGQDPYSVSIYEIFCGTIFLMSKYGYRIDLGTAAGGLSFGPEVGIGALMGGGSVDIYNDAEDDTSGADTELMFGPRIELGIEAAFRFGKNFRLLSVVGLNVGPGLEWESAAIDGEMMPVQPDIRLGFALNY